MCSLCCPGLVLSLPPAVLFRYVSLASLLTRGILACCDLYGVIYAFVLIANGCVALALNSWPLESVEIVRRFHDIFEHPPYIASWSGWLWPHGSVVGFTSSGSLDLHLRLDGPYWGQIYALGRSASSVGNIIAFILTVLTAYVCPPLSVSCSKRYLPTYGGQARLVLLNIEPSTRHDIGLGFAIGVAALGVNSPGNRFGRSVRCWHRVRAPGCGEQFCLRLDPAVRASDQRWRYHTNRRPCG